MQPVWPYGQSLLPQFKSYRLGATLAYNLCKEGTRSKGRERLHAVVSGLTAGSTVMLVFGEIDCRIHLSRRCLQEGRDISGEVNVCADRYCGVVREVAQAGLRTLVWGVVPSTPIDGKDGAIGSCTERNEITRALNEAIKRRMPLSAQYVSIFDQLLNKDGTTNPEYFVDDLHLSQRAMPLALNALKDFL